MRASRHLSIRARGAFAAALALGACAPQHRTLTQGEILLYVDTDASLPSGPDRTPSTAAPLFDRLRVEVYAPGETTPCAGCTNEFELDVSLVEQRRASVGIAPLLGVSGYRARVRLFKRAFADASGEPNADSTVDVTVALPTVTDGVVAEATVRLLTDDVGRPKGSLSAPIEASSGPPQQSAVGTWAGAQRVDCKSAPPAAALCVPGGAAWMGNPHAPGFAPHKYVPEPRLVVLSPFFMSATEITVEQFRASGRTPAESWSGSSSGISAADWCTFTPTPGASERHPVNCATFADAHAYCSALGGDLPTEAQFDYVAGALAGELFPWGQDEPTCADAVFGRGGFGVFASFIAPCRPAAPLDAVAPPGTGARDRLDLPGGAIVDLAGNLSEWTRDLWNRIDEPCWARPGVYRDPWCTTVSPSDGVLVVYRGGGFAGLPLLMESSARTGLDPSGHDAQLGFRCVWKAP